MTSNSKACELFVDGKLHEAREMFSKAIEEDKSSSGILYIRRSEVHLKLGDYMEALQDINSGLGLGLNREERNRGMFKKG